MNLREQLRAKQQELLALKSAIEAGDAEAIAKGEAIQGEITEIEAKVEQAEKGASLLQSMSAIAPVNAAPQAAARTLGEHVVKSIGGRVSRTERFTATAPSFGAKDGEGAMPEAIMRPSGADLAAGFLTTYDRNIVTAPRRQLTIADLLGRETISGTTLKYFVEAGYEGGPGYVKEGEKKPQMSFSEPTPVTEDLVKIAVWYKETDEMLEDTAWFASSIDNRALYLFELHKEDELLDGHTAGGLVGLLRRSGIQTEAATAKADNADAVFRAATKVQTGSGFAADALVINPADYQALRLTKDSNGQYFGGGFFSGQYGEGGILQNPAVWGLRTVVTPAIAEGTFLVGAYRAGASLIEKGGVSVEVANTNEDDFVKNRVTVRVEQRLGLAVRYPSAFVKGTFK